MAEERIIVTSALPYAYSVPHIGNFVGSVLPADIYFKHLMMEGKDAIFICGSDQHGTPIELMAIKKGIEPEALADGMHHKIKGLFEKFGCTFTHYGKTHSEANRATVYEIFRELQRKGHITETESMLAYCNTDRRFLVDRLVEGTCPYCGGKKARGDQCDDCGRLLESSQIIEPHCTLCGGTDIEFRKVKNLALDLPGLQQKVGDYIKSASGNGWSKNAVHKSLSYIEEGLKARDITRRMKWGFPVAEEGYGDSVFYVWFDALIGYIGITREWDGSRWEEYWKKSGVKLIQFMGKDNLEFHTLVWPATLIGADSGFILPHTIYVLEYLTSRSIKFSKSRGVGLNMENALEIMPSDYWRFALAHLMPETADSEFSVEALVEVVNNIMNDKIGNFVHRVLTIARAHRELLQSEITIEEREMEEMKRILHGYRDNFDKIRMREALHSVVGLADMGNALISARTPWVTAKEAAGNSKKGEEFSKTMGTLLGIARWVGILIWPFAPDSGREISRHFGMASDPKISDLYEKGVVDWGVELKPVFSKMADKEREALGAFSR